MSTDTKAKIILFAGVIAVAGFLQWGWAVLVYMAKQIIDKYSK